MANVLKQTNTEILVDRIKSPSEAVKTLLAGAHHLTWPFDVLQPMAVHELSPPTVDEFAKNGRGIGAWLFCLLGVRLGDIQTRPFNTKTYDYYSPLC
jgi:transaldolase